MCNRWPPREQAKGWESSKILIEPIFGSVLGRRSPVLLDI